MRPFTFLFFFSSRRRHTRWPRDWSSDVCSSDLDGCCRGIHNHSDFLRIPGLTHVIKIPAVISEQTRVEHVLEPSHHVNPCGPVELRGGRGSLPAIGVVQQGLTLRTEESREHPAFNEKCGSFVHAKLFLEGLCHLSELRVRTRWIAGVETSFLEGVHVEEDDMIRGRLGHELQSVFDREIGGASCR